MTTQRRGCGVSVGERRHVQDSPHLIEDVSASSTYHSVDNEGRNRILERSLVFDIKGLGPASLCGSHDMRVLGNELLATSRPSTHFECPYRRQLLITKFQPFQNTSCSMEGGCRALRSLPSFIFCRQDVCGLEYAVVVVPQNQHSDTYFGLIDGT